MMLLFAFVNSVFWCRFCVHMRVWAHVCACCCTYVYQRDCCLTAELCICQENRLGHTF